MSSHDPVKTAARTLDLFEIFARERRPLSLTEIAQHLNSPVSSCHALIRTFQARGYVYVLDARKRVYPTKRLATVADPYSSMIRCWNGSRRSCMICGR